MLSGKEITYFGVHGAGRGRLAWNRDCRQCRWCTHSSPDVPLSPRQAWAFSPPPSSPRCVIGWRVRFQVLELRCPSLVPALAAALVALLLSRQQAAPIAYQAAPIAYIGGS